jgi:hypothetical protein
MIFAGKDAFAGTSAHVYITMYGTKSTSSRRLLNDDGNEHFAPVRMRVALFPFIGARKS